METIHTFLNEKDYHIKGFSWIVKKISHKLVGSHYMDHAF